MKVLLGEFTGCRVPRLQAMGWGRMMIERPFTPYAWEPWALDNGAYRMFRAGAPYVWTKFDDQLARLDAELLSGRLTPPMFAVLPDCVGDARASLRLTIEWLERASWTRPGLVGPPEWGAAPFDRFWIPRAMAVQDGMTTADLEAKVGGVPLICYFDWLFLGGSTEFKYRTAPEWRALLNHWGGRFHYGRAGTLRKLEHAYSVGADSCDSAFPMWTDERWSRFERAWTRLGHPRPQLELIA